MTDLTRAAVVEQARAWMGTPFHHQAATRGVGVDCIGLVSGVAQGFGMPEASAWRADPRFRGYGRLPVTDKLLQACDEYLERIPTPTAKPGDVLLFRFYGAPMHFGIISSVDPLAVVHAYSLVGRVVENRIDEKWRRRIAGAYRFKAMTDG